MSREDIILTVAWGAFIFGVLISLGFFVFVAITQTIVFLWAIVFWIAVWVLINYVFAKPIGILAAHLIAPMIAGAVFSCRPRAGYDSVRRHIKRHRRRK